MKSSDLLQLLRENDVKLGAWLYSSQSLARLCSETDAIFKQTAARAKKYGILESAAKGWWFFPFAQSIPNSPIDALARSLRASSAIYASLESELSRYGLISQIPTVATYMTTGRRGLIPSRFGLIEFTHTKRTGVLNDKRIRWASDRQIWVANADRALEDLKNVGRNLNLVVETE